MEMGRLSSLLLLFACFCAHILAKQRELPPKLLEDLVNNHNTKFTSFKTKYKKRYSNPSEQLYRNLIHFRNEKAVTLHNLNPQAIYTMELNEFADLDAEEFSLTYANLIMPDESVKIFAKNVEKKVELQREDCFCKVENQFKQLQLKARIKSDKDIVAQRKYQFYSARSIGFQKEEQRALNFPKELLSLPEDQYEVIQQKLDPNRPDYMRKSTRSERPPTFPSSLTELFNFHSSPPATDPQLQLTDKTSQKKSSLNEPIPTTTLPSTMEQKQKQTIQQENTGTENPAVQQNQNLIQKSQLTTKTNSAKENSLTVEANSLTVEENSVPVQNNQRRLLVEDLSLYNSDWTQFVGQARTQGLCGACYAFAAVQNLEAVLAIYAFNSVIELSVQQVIDCAGYTNLTLGCDGGYLEGPFVYLKNFGVTTSYAYPYTSGSTGEVESCKTTQGFFKISSYKALPFGNCTALRETLLKKPVSVAIASYRLQFYQSGVFTDCNSYIDHAVIVIGYQYGKGWKIKNSWGSNWGESGFAWLADGNSCSLCNYPMVPKIDLEPPENP